MPDPVTILYFKQEECFSEWTLLSYKHTGPRVLVPQGKQSKDRFLLLKGTIAYSEFIFSG
ncbi:hypothetical protein BFAG_03056 [Bacteroides fragilis 3_1_12]|uniref:Cyclic nucleotide-binding domain-containing protein n=1 Tax=Bacteroides fragilis 3_1_12 TaxID=457424 RepID=A0ABN0BN80_BACFG|nr:hypothetical protein BFAG_03056 [Bacteroides fragilis 3_1_12]